MGTKCKDWGVIPEGGVLLMPHNIEISRAGLIEMLSESKPEKLGDKAAVTLLSALQNQCISEDLNLVAAIGKSDNVRRAWRLNLEADPQLQAMLATVAPDKVTSMDLFAAARLLINAGLNRQAKEAEQYAKYLEGGDDA